MRERVISGGHNIPTAVIERRYDKGILNLFDLYIPEIDTILIFDNSEGFPELIAEKIDQNVLTLRNKQKFSLLTTYYAFKKRKNSHS